MNLTQIRSMLERIVTLGVGYAVGRGLVPEALSAELVGTVMGLIAVAWGFYNNRPAALVQKAEALDEVKKVQVSEASGIADSSVTGAKVTDRQLTQRG